MSKRLIKKVIIPPAKGRVGKILLVIRYIPKVSINATEKAEKRKLTSATKSVSIKIIFPKNTAIIAKTKSPQKKFPLFPVEAILPGHSSKQVLLIGSTK